MAYFDTEVKAILTNLLIPVVIFFLIYLVFGKTLWKLVDKVAAFLLNGFIAPVNKRIGGEKEQLFRPLHDLVKNRQKQSKSNLILLEIGAGGGANFKFYPPGTKIICVDPNPYFETYLKDNISQYPHVKLQEFIVTKGEDMAEVPDCYCDAAVCSLVLCTTEDVDQVLKEVKRILKPGGIFFFIEHVSAPHSSWVYTLMCVLDTVWPILGFGCHLIKETWFNIEQAGFSNLEYRKFTLPTWFIPLKYVLVGVATK